MPVRFRGRIGDAMQPEAIIETPVPIVVDRLWGQDMDISDQDLTMTIDRFGERYVEPAVEIIGNLIDGEGTDQWVNIYNFTGTPGTTPTSLTTYTGAGVIMANHAVPKGKMRALVVSPEMEAGVLGFAANIFNPQKEISRQYEEGTMGYAVGFKWSMDQNIARPTLGLCATSTPVIPRAPNQTGEHPIPTTSGWNASTKCPERWRHRIVCRLQRLQPDLVSRLRAEAHLRHHGGCDF